MKLPALWRQFGEGNPAITVGVVDSGIEYNHPEIRANVKVKQSEARRDGRDNDGNGFIDDHIGWDFVKNENLPYDRGGHGMMMATIIAGVKDNGFGGSGICPSCTILSARFINHEGLGDDEDAVRGIKYAVGEKVSVLNLSFAGEGRDASLARALQLAEDADVLVVTSAGNDGENINHEEIYPAGYNYDNMLTVAAVDQQGKLLESSNFGDRVVHLGVPGEEIQGVWLGEWDKGSGTSNAAAVMSGAAALLRSYAPNLSAPELKKIFLATAKRKPWLAGKLVSEGLLDLEAAVSCARTAGLPCLRGKGKGW
jgi:thermitase